MTTKTVSISLPPRQIKEMERIAKKENRTMSELLREAFRRYVQPQARPATVVEALHLVREDARQKETNRLTQKEINAEIAADRGQHRGRKKLERPA
jgi:Arc/MetJ-type ribon-helix-helix transcriptional regulator